MLDSTLIRFSMVHGCEQDPLTISETEALLAELGDSKGDEGASHVWMLVGCGLVAERGLLPCVRPRAADTR